MEIKEVKETIIVWIKSCNRVEQIDGLEKSAPAIIDNLFGYACSDLTISLTKAELSTAMDAQLKVINEVYEIQSR